MKRLRDRIKRMADSRFFKKRKPLSVSEIISLTGATLKDSSMESVMINDVASISAAKEGDCLLYTSPSPRDVEESRMPSSA